MSTITPVILCGGSGSRLWPLSRTLEPKQFQKLTSDQSLFQNTMLRFTGTAFGAPMIITNKGQEAPLCVDIATLPGGAVQEPMVILEPAMRSTAPAIAVAALLASEKGADPILLVTPSDHEVARREILIAAIESAIDFVNAGGIVLFGITPTGPETGFGYIRSGDATEHGVSRVAAFVEKPSLERAKELLMDPRHTWNSGMFLFRASTMLAELQEKAPDVLAAAKASIAGAQRGPSRLALGSAFETAPEISIDNAVMESSDRLGVVPVSPGWSDLGSFEALWQFGPANDQANVVIGDVLTHEVTGSYIRASQRTVSVIGLHDIVLVDTPDALLVCDRTHSQDVKRIVSRLAADNRECALTHRVHLGVGSEQREIHTAAGTSIEHVRLSGGGRVDVCFDERAEERQILVLSGKVHLRTFDAEITIVTGGTFRCDGNVPMALINEDRNESILLMCTTHVTGLGLPDFEKVAV